MKRLLKVFCLLLAVTVLACGCGKKNEYKLNEKTFFMIMTNLFYYPEDYQNKAIEYDCFIYDLTDTSGNVYRLGVRKCSSSYGCTCGKDTIIGFILKYEGEIPTPIDQSENNSHKRWVHLRGKLNGSTRKKINIYSYDEKGNIDTTKTETIELLEFNVESLTEIDGTKLAYYVTK